MPDDEAILAALDARPDAFAELYRRQVGALLDHVRRRDPDRAADVCAETFAAAIEDAHRFDPARGPVADWLTGIADRELAHARRRGIVGDGARRRLGMAELDPGPGFVDALEEELVAAARFQATRRRRVRLRLPRIGRPAAVALAILAVLAAAGVAAVRMTGGGDGDEIADAGPPPPPNATFELVATQRLTNCREPAAESLARSEEFHDLALLGRPRQEADRLPFAAHRLPILAFDPRATRRATQSRPDAPIRLVPSTHVAAYGRCGTDDDSGICLVAGERSFRCFPIADVRSGRAVARTPDGMLIGIVPDGIERVTLSVAGPSARAEVTDNVFETQLAATRGTEVELAMQWADGCLRGIAPEVLRRTAILRGPDQPTLVLPAAALGALREWPIDAVAEDAARFWGTRDHIEFWVVPVVPGGQGRCAPASRVCVIAIPETARPEAECVLRRDEEGEDWRLAPLGPRRAVIYGVVPDGVSRARVTIDGVTGDVDARDNIVGGLLPFPYERGADTRVELLR
jgi:DNA-directed RNA polymerase specialized sigma24 family protein